MNPYRARRHFEEAPWLGPTDREAAEVLWRAYRQMSKRASKLEFLMEKLREKEAAARDANEA